MRTAVAFVQIKIFVLLRTLGHEKQCARCNDMFPRVKNQSVSCLFVLAFSRLAERRFSPFFSGSYK